MKSQASALGFSWVRKEYSDLLVKKITETYNISDILARILAQKNIDFDDISNFLDPKIKNILPSPFHLLDMKKGVSHTIKAIKDNKNICIYGDYDVDGATSSALIKNYFKQLDIDVRIYIPDRLTEGYGPNIESLQKLKDQNIDLVITVDCGTASLEELKYAKSIGLDVIVIDHHISEEIPEAIAVINPNRIDETTSYRNLAAVGVSFLFLCGINISLKKEGYFETKNEPNLMNSLDIVALGTICDLMKLDMLNRTLVSQGLKIMAKRGNIGLSLLSDMAGINTEPSTYNLGFIIGPRINAGGRVGESHLGSSLLSCNDENVAREISMKLEIYNNERKDIEKIVLDEALILAEKEIENYISFVHSDKWHVGVIGIVASRLKDRYNKPSFVVSVENGIGKGSARSIRNIDLGSLIIDAKNRGLIINGGGHAMAAGFTVDLSLIEDFKHFLNINIEKKIKSLENINLKTYDINLDIGGLNLDLVEELQKLSPYGPGNNEPLIRIDNLYVIKSDLRAEKHVSCILGNAYKTIKNQTISSIAFNANNTEIADILLSKKYSNFSIICSLGKNQWNGFEKIQVIIKDIIVSN
jgi:single-stranded-DNA-specific exonuclease